MKLIYPAHSKHYFYFRMHISQFVLQQGCVPLNPFMIFEYFMLDTVNRDVIRAANNTMVERADEVWVFGPVSNGVLAEIRLAKKLKKPIRYFSIVKSRTIEETTKDTVELEEDVARFKDEL